MFLDEANKAFPMEFTWLLPTGLKALPVPEQDISVVQNDGVLQSTIIIISTSQVSAFCTNFLKNSSFLRSLYNVTSTLTTIGAPVSSKFPFNISISISIVCTTSNRRLSDLQSLSISFVHYSLYAWMQNQIRWMDRTVLQRTGMQASRYLHRQCLLWIDVFFLETICIARLGMKSLPHQLSYLAFLIYVHET